VCSRKSGREESKGKKEHAVGTNKSLTTMVTVLRKKKYSGGENNEWVLACGREMLNRGVQKEVCGGKKQYAIIRALARSPGWGLRGGREGGKIKVLTQLLRFSSTSRGRLEEGTLDGGKPATIEV